MQFSPDFENALLIIIMKKIGQLGEEIISQWLEKKEYKIIESNWHCPWGEIDLIAINKDYKILIFVEVKTRSKKNWDGNGIFSITNKKQDKLTITANSFLSKYPEYDNFNCRFDVALLTYQKIGKNNNSKLVIKGNLGEKIDYQGYQFEIFDYIQNAFD